MTYAPIALFVYNRPEHTRRTVEALASNEHAHDSELLIFADGSKSPNDRAVESVRQYLRTIHGFKNVHVIERDTNFGLAQNITHGVTDIVNRFGSVIVLEDDMVTSPHFLVYMNEALNLYRNDEGVISIHGYSYPTCRPLPETFFLRGADCWGWATWKRGWNLYESDGTKLLEQLESKGLERDFDFQGSYGYTDMLRGQIVGKNDSWAIRWYASAFLKNKLTLYPGHSLVQNIGLDGSGRHSGASNQFGEAPGTEPLILKKIATVENHSARKAFARFFQSLRPSLQKRIRSKARRLLKRSKRFVKQWLPPVILKAIPRKKKYGYFGVYPTWNAAARDASGYDSPAITEKVKDSALQVKRGEAAYERDSIAMEHIEYSWHILAPLLWIASQNSNRLRVLDFGGGLGTTYYQNRDFLAHLDQLRWGIIEQPAFVKHGGELFEDETLSFHSSVEDYYRWGQADVVICSSSLQYLERPYDILGTIIAHKPKYILLDKTPFQNTSEDIITVQRVPKHIYDASYPSWVFSAPKFKAYIEKYYSRLVSFNQYKKEIFQLPGYDIEWSGHLFERNDD